MKEIQLNPQQVEAVSHKDGPMIVLSVAGSGKTMVLIERIVHLIEEHSINPANLLANTFAKKAVLEIQSRLDKRLNGYGEKAMVCTFHSMARVPYSQRSGRNIERELIKEIPSHGCIFSSRQFFLSRKVPSMPIRLAQARLIPQNSRDHRPDHRTGIRTPLGPPDTLQMAGAGRPLIREKMLKLQQSTRVI